MKEYQEVQEVASHRKEQSGVDVTQAVAEWTGHPPTNYIEWTQAVIEVAFRGARNSVGVE